LLHFRSSDENLIFVKSNKKILVTVITCTRILIKILMGGSKRGGRATFILISIHSQLHILSLSLSFFLRSVLTLSLSTLMASDINSHEAVQRKLNVKISGVCQTLCVIFPNYTPDLIIRTVLVTV